MTYERRDFDRTRVTLEMLSLSHGQRANENARGLPGLPTKLERELRLVRLQRLIRKRTSALELALCGNEALWRELQGLWEARRERREWAYFEMGFDEGVAAMTRLCRCERDGGMAE